MLRGVELTLVLLLEPLDLSAGRVGSGPARPGLPDEVELPLLALGLLAIKSREVRDQFGERLGHRVGVKLLRG